MMNKIVYGFIFILLVGLGAAVSSTPSYCCEKTTSGGWCVNDVQSACAPGYNAAPTSCDTTSYCRLGTCYDSEEGICMGNTPQRVCNDNNGTWDPREPEEVPQCQLGCCIIADQAAFVSLVRCKKLSSFFGVENNYRTDISDEVSCIATAQAQDKGACVYESNFERVCDFTTREKCGSDKGVQTINQTNISLSSEKTFYKDYLCSAEELSTSCARETSTTCEGGDVYWVDSCGNLENVYSSNKKKSWNNGRVLDANDVCATNDGSNVNCGNCNYLAGTRCSKFDGLIGGPSGSDYYCQKTECVDGDGKKRLNGESWCISDAGAGKAGDRVGSRYYKESCVDGDVKVEPCADFRNEICIEGSIETTSGSFGTAACRVNRWQDCIRQDNKDDCTNIDQRDCTWLPSVLGMIIGGKSQGDSVTYSNPSASKPMFNNPTASPITGNSIFGGEDTGEKPTPTTITNRAGGICVPNFPPGLKFWEEGSAKQICGQANAKCVVVYEKGLIGGSNIVEGAECLDKAWAEGANSVCSALGDCGGAVNYNGEYSGDGYKWIEDGAEKFLS